MNYKMNKPYPSLDELDMHIPYGKILLSHLGGLQSEMNAVSLYFYNSVVLEKEWPDLASAMYCISREEMQHLEILTRICFHLGVDPRLWSFQDDLLEYWSPGYNVYPRQIESMLKNAIKQKQTSIDIYKQHLSCIDEQIIKDVLEDIIIDEQIHLQIFEDFLKTYDKRKPE